MAFFEQDLHSQLYSKPLLIKASSVFRDLSVLSPHYVPKELPFRERQINEILSILSPAIKGQKPRNLILYGKTGTGKTCCMKKIMQNIGSVSGNFAHIHYINCRIYNSRYRVLQKLLKNYFPEVEKSGFSLPYFYEKLIEVTSDGKQLIVILDEIDMVKDLDELIYTLTRSNDEILGGGVSLVGISNRLAFKDCLDPRSRSSLYESEMVFPPYTAEQLQMILTRRVGEGFYPGTVDPSAINLAAAITSQENGDARYALKLINKAGELAEQDGKPILTDREVELARKKVEIDIVKETINTLPEMHRIALFSVASLTVRGSKYSRLNENHDDFLFSGEAYEEYESLCKRLGKKSRTPKWFKEYISDLEILGLIATMPSGKGVRGQTTLIKVGQNAKDIFELLKPNFSFSLSGISGGTG